MPFTVRENDLRKYGNDQSHWDQVYQGLIKPAVENAGFECYRDDEDVRSRMITDNIWRKVEDADMVLCDLSSYNPNVYLELGWAFRSDKKFLLIKDDITDFVFDLNSYFTYNYSHRLQPLELKKDIKGIEKLIKKHTQILKNNTQWLIEWGYH